MSCRRPDSGFLNRPLFGGADELGYRDPKGCADAHQGRERRTLLCPFELTDVVHIISEEVSECLLTQSHPDSAFGNFCTDRPGQG